MILPRPASKTRLVEIARRYNNKHDLSLKYKTNYVFCTQLSIDIIVLSFDIPVLRVVPSIKRSLLIEKHRITEYE